MSWITDLAGRAETLLNRLDTEAGAVLSLERRNSTSAKSTRSEGGKAARVAHQAAIQSSTSVPSNLSSYGVPPAAPSYPQAPPSGPPVSGSPKVAGKKGRRNKDEVLIEFLNSPTQDAAMQDSMASSVMTSSVMTSSSFSLGHSRQSSVSSVSSFMALSGRETPASATVDIEQEEVQTPSRPKAFPQPIADIAPLSPETGSSGSGSGSVGADAYVTVDTPSDVNISAPPSTDGSTSSGAMSGSVDGESSLLRKEVASLNQEMSQVLRRAKDAERETQQLRSQVSGLLSQQSVTDQAMREVQQRELDLMETVSAKDSQLGVLRVRLAEADQDVVSKDNVIKDLQAENKRLLEGANESSGLHSHALKTLEERLADLQATRDREMHQHNTTHAELNARVAQLEEGQQAAGKALSDAQRRLEDERSKALHLNNQVVSLRGEVTAAQDELAEYKSKAGRILQSKEKLIGQLKEERGVAGVGSGGPDDTLHEAELTQIRAERDLLREELEAAGVRVRQLQAELTDVETSAQESSASAAFHAQGLEDNLGEERKRRAEVEAELRQLQEELRCAHEEMTRQKVNVSSRLQERDAEIERLRKQVAHKQSSSSSLAELEQRVHGLTESLIHKQTSIETLSTEKHSLVIQMERLKQQYDESQNLLNRDPTPNYRQDEVRNRVPAFLVESPFDNGVARGVKRAYSTLDRFSVRLGIFLRRYPIARVFVIVYMCLLHVWVMVVLLTYTPEVHGPEYHHMPMGTMPHNP